MLCCYDDAAVCSLKGGPAYDRATKPDADAGLGRFAKRWPDLGAPPPAHIRFRVFQSVTTPAEGQPNSATGRAIEVSRPKRCGAGP